MTTHHVVDTNVALVANGTSDVAAVDCVKACLLRLREIRDNHVIVLDTCGLILREYLNYNPHGSPRGAGDAFMVWALDNQANPDVCVKAVLTPLDGQQLPNIIGDPDPDLVEFPADPNLADFDRSDRKFVAAAISSGVNPIVLNASDSDWKNHEEHLVKYIGLEHLCG